MNIGKNIREYLKKNGIKQKYLAENLKLSEATIAQILKDNSTLKIDKYVQICNLLKVDFNYFLN